MALGLLAAGAAKGVQAGIGMGVEKWGNKQQVKQAEKLQDLQMQGAKEMGRFNQGLALEMWEKTGYGAQRAQMEAAGLNPGLMYSQGGSGGTTSTPTGQVSGQQAQSGGDKALGMMQLGQQMQMNKAQIDLMKAQENKTNVEATKTAGVDTELGKAQVTNLMQVTSNQAIQGQIMQYDKQIREIEANIAGKTEEDIIRTIRYQADNVEATARIQRNNGQISDETYREVIKQSKLETTRKGLELLIMKEQQQNIKADTDLKDNTRDLQNYQKNKMLVDNLLTQKQGEKIISEIYSIESGVEQRWADIKNDKQKLQQDATYKAIELELQTMGLQQKAIDGIMDKLVRLVTN